MRPVNFAASNKVFTAPKGVENVADLHVNLDTREDGGMSMVSLWQFDEDELQAIREGDGLVLLEIFGDQHPVVSLHVAKLDDQAPQKQGGEVG